jgi:hypothetical protein
VTAAAQAAEVDALAAGTQAAEAIAASEAIRAAAADAIRPLITAFTAGGEPQALALSLVPTQAFTFRVVSRTSDRHAVRWVGSLRLP